MGRKARKKSKPSAAKRIKACDYYSKDHKAWLQQQEEGPKLNRRFKPKKLAPGEERMPFQLRFMLECKELMELPKEERKKRLLEKANEKTPYMLKLEARTKKREEELAKVLICLLLLCRSIKLNL